MEQSKQIEEWNLEDPEWDCYSNNKKEASTLKSLISN
jgi:hypothetical protein